MRRTLTALPFVLATALVLAGCAGAASSPDATPDPDASAAAELCAAPGGAAVDGVTVTGDFGSVPTVDFDAPLTVDATQRAVVLEGDGDATTAGDPLDVAYTVVNGTDGTVLDSYGYAAGEMVTWSADTSTILLGFAKTLGCAAPGSRVVGVIPPSEAFGEAGSPQVGVAPEDTIVLVLDILRVRPTQAWGVDQPAVDGMPTVTLAEDGSPDVVVPSTDPPTELQVAVLKKGDGAIVAQSDVVEIQYHGVAWSSGEMFQESWPTPISNSVAGFVPGFTQALVGQTLGSQVLVVIPPALAYGEAGSSSNELAGETLVFVIDILGATAG